MRPSPQSNRAANIAQIILVLAFISNSIYCLQYMKESFDRNRVLLKTDYTGRQLYIEKTFKYRPVYQLSQWADKAIPAGYLLSLNADPADYGYYYSRLKYFLWPKRIVADLNIISPNLYGKEKSLNELASTDIVLAIDMKPGRISRKIGGIYAATIKGREYCLVAKYGKADFILMERSFFRKTVLADTAKWQAVIQEFKVLYPDINIKKVNL